MYTPASTQIIRYGVILDGDRTNQGTEATREWREEQTWDDLQGSRSA
jgi:hypothetical protein